MNVALETSPRKEVPQMASKNVQVSNELNFDELVLGASGPVLVDFTATWCSPCKLQAAILDGLAEGSLGAAIVKVDTYPDAECTGKIASIAQATGAEFAVLPPQNASGNWVKVVQRIPVRVAVKCKEGDPPLRTGMSAVVEIDTGHSRSFSDILKAIGLGK